MMDAQQRHTKSPGLYVVCNGAGFPYEMKPNDFGERVCSSAFRDAYLQAFILSALSNVASFSKLV